MIDNQPLYRTTQLIAIAFSFALIYFAILYSHQIKMEEIQETLANVRARKKIVEVPVENAPFRERLQGEWLEKGLESKILTNPPERDFVNIWPPDKKED